jgi:hypothetical protein
VLGNESFPLLKLANRSFTEPKIMDEIVQVPTYTHLFKHKKNPIKQAMCIFPTAVSTFEHMNHSPQMFGAKPTKPITTKQHSMFGE